MKFTFKEGIITDYLISVISFRATFLGVSIFLFLGICSQSYAQQRPPLPPVSLQDIRAEINEIEYAEDKLQHYVEMSNRYLRNSPDSMLLVSEEIKNIEGIDVQRKEAFSLFIAASAWRLLDSDSALYYGKRASEKLRELNEHNSFLMAENLVATQLTIQRDYIQAESLYVNAISYREEVEDQVDYPIHYFYGNLGNLYVNVGAHDLAIDMFEKFLEHADNPQDRCNILSKISTSFAELGDYDRSIELLSPCLEYENLAPHIKAIVRGNLGGHYEMKGDSTRALALFEEAATITSISRIPNIGGGNLIRLGTRYMDMGKLQKADSVAQVLRGSTFSFMRPNERIVKNRFFASLEFTKGNYGKAIEFADKAIALATQHNLSRLLAETYLTKANAYEQLGNITLALENQRLQMQLDDEQVKLSNERALEMQSIRYQLQNKEAQLLNVSSQLENVKARTILIISILIMMAGYIVYRYRLRYLLMEERTRTRIAMDLHDDLSGTLSSISFFSKAVIREQDKNSDPNRFLSMIDNSATEAKEKINDIIWAIDPSKDDWFTFLKKCKRFAADALDSKEIEYEFDVSETFHTPVKLELRQNLWLIYKEMINNLVSHSKATKAEIVFKEDGGNILLAVSDNGIGFDAEQESNRNGLKNIKQRTELIDGKLTLDTAPDEGTKWTLRIEV